MIRASGEGGTSLVSVMIALAILGVAAAAFATAAGNYFTARGIDSGRRSVEDVELGFRTFIWKQVQAYAQKSSCDPNEFWKYFDGQLIGTWGLPSFVNSPIAVSMGAPLVMQAAAQRCGNPIVPDGTGTQLHFCLKMGRTDAAVSNASFLMGRMPFVEVFVNIVDVPSQTLQSCQALSAQVGSSASSLGAQVYYGFYWEKITNPSGPALFGSYIGNVDEAI